MRTYLALFFLAALFSLLITPAVRWLGRRLRAYGQARDGREHPQIPRLGGLAIFLATLASWGVLLLVPNLVRAQFLAAWRVLATIMIPGTLVLILGVYDDLAGATPRQKLVVETLAAAMVWWGGLRIVRIPIFGYDFQNTILSFVLTAFWIVAVTNSLNLIDGLDGLAAGIAFFVTTSVFVVSMIHHNVFGCILAVTLAGALLGFLQFNFAPASIYLGDSGSLFLGFFLGSLAIHSSQKSSTLLAIVVPFVAFGLPLLDTSLAIFRRFLSGRPLFAADEDHIHHRLLQRMLSPRVAVLFLYALAALFSLGSLLILHTTGSLVALVAVLAGAIGWFLTSRIQYEELSELNLYVSRAVQSQRRVLVNEILIRKVSNQLKEAPSLERCWELLASALEALDFDGSTCLLAEWPNGDAPLLPGWSRSGQECARDCWNVSVPLRIGERTVGELRLWRVLSKRRLLFQFSSLLDSLIPTFELSLKKFYDAQEKRASKEPTVLQGSAFQPGPLATERKV